MLFVLGDNCLVMFHGGQLVVCLYVSVKLLSRCIVLGDNCLAFCTYIECLYLKSNLQYIELTLQLLVESIILLLLYFIAFFR